MLQKEFILEQVLDVAHLPVLLGGDGIVAAQAMAERIVETFQAHRKLIYCGFDNHRSIAAHLAGEMRNGLVMKRPPLPVSLLDTEEKKTKTGDPQENILPLEESLLQQLAAEGEENDTLLILNSGKNKTLDSLLATAITMNLTTLVFSGYPRPKKTSPPYLFYIPSANPARLEEVFLIMGHIICTLVESILFSDGAGV
jgi:D-sedoheptulose 7-phosphate isomerase